MASSSNNHTSKRRMARSDEQPCDLCNRHHQGAACPVMKFVKEQMAQFSRRGNRKRRDSSRGQMRQDHTTSPVGNRRIGRPSFLASRSEKTPARGSKRTIDRWFEDFFLDKTSIQIPDRRSEVSHARTDAKDKSHIQCFVCNQYGHYNTQCNQNPKARKYLRRGNLGEQHTPTTTEGGGHEDPTTIGHMVDATIAERDVFLFCSRHRNGAVPDRTSPPSTLSPLYHFTSPLPARASPANKPQPSIRHFDVKLHHLTRTSSPPLMANGSGFFFVLSAQSCIVWVFTTLRRYPFGALLCGPGRSIDQSLPPSGVVIWLWCYDPCGSRVSTLQFLAAACIGATGVACSPPCSWFKCDYRHHDAS
ncbi:hypothetical protein Dimus_017717 [Dionaea muscipula]